METLQDMSVEGEDSNRVLFFNCNCGFKMGLCFSRCSCSKKAKKVSLFLLFAIVSYLLGTVDYSMT